MPVIYYTKEEHQDALTELQRQALALAQQVCRLTGFRCIVGIDGSAFGERLGKYCHECPALKNCPYPYKEFPK